MRKNKYRYLYVLQGDYGCGHGWEDITQSEDRKEVVQDKRDYERNAPEYLYRVIQRRKLNTVNDGMFKPVEKDGYRVEVTDQWDDSGRAMKEIKLSRDGKVQNRVLSSDIRDQEDFKNLAYNLIQRHIEVHGL